MATKIVVVGGQADGRLIRETEVLDGKGWEDVAEIPTPPPPPPPREEHLGAASDGRYLCMRLGAGSWLRTGRGCV